jgi:SAM-dependent methyltransferase
LTVDRDEYRASSLQQWERSAEGWGAEAPGLQALTGPVSQWLVEEVHPQPGQTILELAAGPGETGFLAAELIRPGGTLICTDFAEGMLEAARARAREIGLDNVEFRRLDAESMDLEAASIDGVLCRWGYMLMADPGAALRETRRVLRPLGRVALAVWGPPQDNPWVTIAGEEVRRLAGAPEPDFDAPGMFALARPGRLEDALADAGFTDVRVQPLDLRFTYDSFEEWWRISQALGRPLADLVGAMEPEQLEALEAALRQRFAAHAAPDGRLDVPARPVVAVATA